MLALQALMCYRRLCAWGVTHGQCRARGYLNAWESHLRDWQSAAPLAFHKLADYDEVFQLKAHVATTEHISLSYW
jgi:hypothetical protein